MGKTNKKYNKKGVTWLLTSSYVCEQLNGDWCVSTMQSAHENENLPVFALGASLFSFFHSVVSLSLSFTISLSKLFPSPSAFVVVLQVGILCLVHFLFLKGPVFMRYLAQLMAWKPAGEGNGHYRNKNAVMMGRLRA